MERGINGQPEALKAIKVSLINCEENWQKKKVYFEELLKFNLNLRVKFKPGPPDLMPVALPYELSWFN